MEFNWSILGWIAGLLFVYIFGLYEGRSQGYKKRKAEEGQQKKDQPPPAPAPDAVTVDEAGLLRIKKAGSDITLELDGTQVDRASLTTDQRKRLIEILTIIRPWLEGRPASAPSAPESVAPPPPKATALKPSPATPEPVRIASAPPPAPRPGTIPREDRPPAPANSIVAQIDTVLQARLAGTPLEERGVFLTESPEGGVAVYVGLTRYDGIDEVPDPDIKAAIRAAISEWEQKYTPGA